MSEKGTSRKLNCCKTFATSKTVTLGKFKKNKKCLHKCKLKRKKKKACQPLEILNLTSQVSSHMYHLLSVSVYNTFARVSYYF